MIAKANDDMEYEFNAGQNESIDDLARKLRFVGLTSSLVGTGLVAAGIAAAVLGRPGFGLGYGLQGLVLVLMGLWTRSAGSGFQRIVDTQGRDITNLMNAITELRRIYGAQRAVCATFFVAVALAVQLTFLIMTRGG